MTSIKEDTNDEEDLYSDLPNFQYEDSVKKLEHTNKTLLIDKQKLQQKIDELEKLVEKINKDKCVIKKENNSLSYNISSLYKTAQREIQRKDKMIQDLRRAQEDSIFRRLQLQKRSRRDSFDQRNQDRNEENETQYSVSRRRSPHKHGEAKNLEEKMYNNEVLEKLNNSKASLKDNQTNKEEDNKGNNSHFNKMVVEEIGDNPRKSLSSVSLSSDEVHNVQKTLTDTGVNCENKINKDSETCKEHNESNNQSYLPKSSDPKNEFQTKKVAPKLNVPMTAYTRRMYKKQYGVSPEKTTLKERFAFKKKGHFLSESKTELTSPKSVCSRVLVNANEQNCVLEKSNIGEDAQDEKHLNKDVNVSSQNSEENIASNAARKNVRRISRVGKKVPEKNVSSSDFIKLGERSISKKTIEQRIVTNSNKISKFSQLITKNSEKMTRSFKKEETSSPSLTLMINLEKKVGEKCTSGCKLTPDETVESVINKAKSLSPIKKQEDVEQKINTPSQKLQSNSIGLIRNKHRINHTTISPATTYSINNQSNKESNSVENMTQVKDNVSKENVIMTNVETGKPKSNTFAYGKSRQAQFLNSLFGSPTKPDPIQKTSKCEPNNHNLGQNLSISGEVSKSVINDKVYIENKMLTNTASVGSKQITEVVCINENIKLSSENLINASKTKTNSQMGDSNLEVLTKLFQFQKPMTISDKNLTPVEFESEINHQKMDNNPPLLAMNESDTSTFKTSPQNSMSGFMKNNENSCFSVSEDTIGMVTSLARVRTKISPIKTPVKKSLVSVESGYENASSPKVMTKTLVQENEIVTHEDNKQKNKTNLHSISTSSSLCHSPIKNSQESTSEHCDFRRSKRVLAIIKKSFNSSTIKAESMSLNHTPSFKRKIHISDSSANVETKRQNLGKIPEKNEDVVKSVTNFVGSSKRDKNKECIKDSKIMAPELNMKCLKQSNDKGNVPNNSDKEKVTDHRSSNSDRKSNDRRSSSNRKSSDRNQSNRKSNDRSPSNKESSRREKYSHSRKQREDYKRKYKTRNRDSSSPRHDEYDTPRARRSRRKVDKCRSKSSSDNEERGIDEHKRKSLEHRTTLLSKHKIFSSGNRSGFQRHSPSEFFNRKQKVSRRTLSNRFHRCNSPSPRNRRDLTPQKTRYSSARKRERTQDINKQRKLNEDLRIEILNKESLKNLSSTNYADKEEHIQESEQSRNNSTPQDLNWKLTLISIEGNKKSEPTPSPSIEHGRSDPRMNVSQPDITLQTECSPQEIRSNRILTDQTNQSNQIVLPNTAKPITTSNVFENKVTKTLVIKRLPKRNIKFEDNSPDSNNELQSQNFRKDTTKCNAKTSQNTVHVDSDKLIDEQQKINTEKDKSLSDQNICALTTENLQKLNELPARCLDSISMHPSNFPKKIVKTPLDFRQKYASVFSNSPDSSCDELDPFGSISDSDESRNTDLTWKP